jgi:hypothetical protein
MLMDRMVGMVGHIVRVVLDARERGKPDWRRVRVRRPNGWSREDFSTYHLEHAQRGDWTSTIERDGDIATIVVGDRLLEGHDAAT